LVIQPLTKLSETRRKQVVGYVVPHLEEGEAVVQWGRIRDPENQNQGFLYLTSLRFIVWWRNQEGVNSYKWGDIDQWGVNKDASRGPILYVNTGDAEGFLQLQTGSKALAIGAGRVVRAFAKLAPDRAATAKDTEQGHVDVEPNLEVEKEKLTPAALIRKISLSVVAAAVLVGAILIIPLPGPWSFLLVIGAFALLAREYDWAEDVLDWVKDKYEKAKAKVRSSRND
jgi:hypothetical protein